MARDRTLKLKLRAVDRMSATIDRVQRKFPKLTRSIKRASVVTKLFNAQTKIMRQSMQKLGRSMKRVGFALTLGLTLPITALAVQSVKTFGSFEQGLRGIEKTTGLSRKAVGQLGERLAQLSTEIPVATGEMLELAKAGGQLGIKGIKNIEKFTVVMAKLSRASDVAGEEGAKSIARILTVTGVGIDKVDRFAAALVDLGNNAAAGEQEILKVANRVAGQIGRFDVASESVLGIATALKAMGKRAESAGSVVGRAFDAIDQATKGAGRNMELLSRLTGIASKDLKKAFRTDAAGVFQKFVVGLGEVEKGGGNVVKILGALGLKGVRINDVLGTLAKRPEVLVENMNRATKAFAENIALQKEFEIQTQSFNSSMIKIGNTFTDLTRLVGAELAPAVEFLGKRFKGFLDFLRDNPTIRTMVIAFAAFAAILGPVVFLAGALLTILPGLALAAIVLQVALIPAAITFLGIAAGIGLVIALSALLIKKWESIKNFFSSNPFGPLLQFIVSLLGPLGKLVSSMLLIGQAQDRLRSSGGLGPSVGAKSKSQGVAQGASRSDSFKGSIGVLFQNAPAGTKIRSEADEGLGLNVGLVGGLQ